MQPTEERWASVPGYEGYYEASDRGRVRSLDRVVSSTSRVGNPYRKRIKGRVLSPATDYYLFVSLKRDGEQSHGTIHSLVALAFLGPRPAGMDVCHNNGNPHDNRLENLRYDTRSQNNLDQVRHGTHPEARRTRCDNDHEFTPENTKILTNSEGQDYRSCNTCRLAYHRVYKRLWRQQRRDMGLPVT